MMIVLEGPDGSGKSTLAKFISEQLRLPIRHSGGPEKHVGELAERVDRYHNDPDLVIYDRHPCVSQNIHLSALRQSGSYVSDDRLKRFYDDKPLLIYCKSNGSLDNHKMSDFASMDHHRRVEFYFDDLCNAYDRWAMRHASVIYRIGDDPTRIVNMVRAQLDDNVARLTDALQEMYRFDPMRDVENFHKKFGLYYTGAPRALPEDLAEFRKDFLREEIAEYCEHSDYAQRELDASSIFEGFDNKNFTSHLEGMLDALVDEVYVALGTAQFHGFDFREAWRRVHDANMKKVRSNKHQRGKRGESKYDIIKPPGWRPPSHTDLVADHIYKEDADAINLDDFFTPRQQVAGE